MNKNEALKLGLQLVEAAESLALDSAICGNYVKEERALIQRSKIAFEEALAQPEQESDDLTAAYLSGVYDGKNKYAPQSFTYEQVKAHIQAALMSSSMPQLQTFTGENPFSPQRKPEQKPVAFRNKQTGEFCTGGFLRGQLGQWTPLYEEHTIPLYITPPQRKPLTDEQLIAAYESEQQGRYGDHIRSLRAIEAAHGIKGE